MTCLYFKPKECALEASLNSAFQNLRISEHYERKIPENKQVDLKTKLDRALINSIKAILDCIQCNNNPSVTFWDRADIVLQSSEFRELKLVDKDVTDFLECHSPKLYYSWKYLKTWLFKKDFANRKIHNQDFFGLTLEKRGREVDFFTLDSVFLSVARQLVFSQVNLTEVFDFVRQTNPEDLWNHPNQEFFCNFFPFLVGYSSVDHIDENILSYLEHWENLTYPISVAVRVYIVTSKIFNDTNFSIFRNQIDKHYINAIPPIGTRERDKYSCIVTHGKVKYHFTKPYFQSNHIPTTEEERKFQTIDQEFEPLSNDNSPIACAQIKNEEDKKYNNFEIEVFNSMLNFLELFSDLTDIDLSEVDPWEVFPTVDLENESSFPSQETLWNNLKKQNPFLYNHFHFFKYLFTRELKLVEKQLAFKYLEEVKGVRFKKTFDDYFDEHNREPQKELSKEVKILFPGCYLNSLHSEQKLREFYDQEIFSQEDLNFEKLQEQHPEISVGVFLFLIATDSKHQEQWLAYLERLDS